MHADGRRRRGCFGDVHSTGPDRAWAEGGTTTSDSATYAATGDRLLSVSRGGQSRGLGHDAAGNVTADTRFDGTVFADGYDDDGRLATVTRNGLPEASYGYDAFQRRVLKTAGGTTRHFLHDPDGSRTSTGSRPRAAAGPTMSAACDRRPYWAGAGARLRSSLPGA